MISKILNGLIDAAFWVAIIASWTSTFFRKHFRLTQKQELIVCLVVASTCAYDKAYIPAYCLFFIAGLDFSDLMTQRRFEQMVERVRKDLNKPDFPSE